MDVSNGLPVLGGNSRSSSQPNLIRQLLEPCLSRYTFASRRSFYVGTCVCNRRTSCRDLRLLQKISKWDSCEKTVLVADFSPETSSISHMNSVFNQKTTREFQW